MPDSANDCKRKKGNTKELSGETCAHLLVLLFPVPCPKVRHNDGPDQERDHGVQDKHAKEGVKCYRKVDDGDRDVSHLQAMGSKTQCAVQLAATLSRTIRDTADCRSSI
jgi:hypothetical protein